MELLEQMEQQEHITRKLIQLLLIKQEMVEIMQELSILMMVRMVFIPLLMIITILVVVVIKLDLEVFPSPAPIMNILRY